MRGKVAGVWNADLARRITPACAGKSKSKALSMMDSWDHPRMCGEKENFREPGRVRVRSPPRMRGKDSPENKEISGRGITPAYAGKSWNSLALKCLLMGSPPRMRGKADGHRKARRRTRITPAYAGKRQPLPGWSKSERDHPRVCGEKTACGLPWLPPWGSPPRMRGKVEFARQTWTTQWDHPRVCGEKQDRVLRRVLRVGITPAYAGKSKESGCPESAPRDHPRVCGEKA